MAAARTAALVLALAASASMARAGTVPIDDFEDGDLLTQVLTGWVVGGSTGNVATTPFDSNPVADPTSAGRRLEVQSVLAAPDAATRPWLTVSCGIPASFAAEHGARTCAATFRFSGSPAARHVLQVWTSEVHDGCHFEAELPAGEDVRPVTVRWHELRQPSWGQQVGAFRPASMTGLAFMAQGPPGTVACITLDDVAFETADAPGGCPRGPVVQAAPKLPELQRSQLRLAARKVQIEGDTTRVPVDFTPGNPAIEARINGQGPFRLVFDTGAEATVLTRAVARRLGLKPFGATTVGGFASGAVSRHEFAHVDALSIGGLTARDLVVALADFVGPPAEGLDGFVGITTLTGVRITLDGPGSAITFETGRERPEPGDLEWLEETLPWVRVDLGGEAVGCLLDTGSSSLLDVTPERAKALGLTDALRPVGWQSGMDAVVRRDMKARWDASVRVGGVVLERPEVGALARTCTVGSDAFRHAITTFDTRARRVRIRAAAPIPSPPVRSRGLHVEWQCGRLVVIDALPGSPAGAAGLAAGQVISTVDGEPVGTLGEAGIRTRLRGDAVVTLGLPDGRQVPVPTAVLLP